VRYGHTVASQSLPGTTGAMKGAAGDSGSAVDPTAAGGDSTAAAASVPSGASSMAGACAPSADAPGDTGSVEATGGAPQRRTPLRGPGIAGIAGIWGAGGVSPCRAGSEGALSARTSEVDPP